MLNTISQADRALTCARGGSLFHPARVPCVGTQEGLMGYVFLVCLWTGAGQHLFRFAYVLFKAGQRLFRYAYVLCNCRIMWYF